MNSQTYNFKINNQNVINNFLSSSPKLIKNKFKFEDSYYQSIKKYFQNIKNNDFTIKDNYKHSDCGRLMGVKTTIQKLSNDLRGELFKSSAYDIDIVNCSFNIVGYIINTFFKDKVNDFKTLLDYGVNRDKYLKYGFDKTKMISVLFNDNATSFIKPNTYDKQFNRLILEISLFHDLIMDNIHLFNYKFKNDATKGSKISYIIFNIENQILQEVINEFKDIIISPIFDGIIVSKECDLENVLNKCNEIGSKYGVKFINKPFPESKLDLDCPPNYDDAVNAYNDMKTEFEENHFLVEDPLIYIKEYQSNGETKFIYYNKGDFKDSVATYNFEDSEGNEIPFFNCWLKDKERRSYKTITWIPSLDDKFNTVDNYNTFKGFNAKLVDVPIKDKFSTLNDNYDGKSVIRFINHLNLLVNYEADGLIYLKNYIADMFQNPAILPGVAILFKSKQGSGKDLMTSILGDILGQHLIHKDAKMENLTGTFNDDLQNKLLIQFNEVGGADGSFNREILKDIITTEMFNINPKYGKKLKCRNFSRPILASNNDTPIQIPQDDRRYVVFKCGDPKEKSYYDKLGAIKSDKRALNSIYSYFMTLDITKFNIKDRFISQEYKNIQSSTCNPFHEFLYEMCNNLHDYSIRNNNGDDYVSCNDIYTGYECYLQDKKLTENIKTNRRDMKTKIMACGAIPIKYRINKVQVHGFKLQFKTLKLYLEKHYIKDHDEDMIEFEDEELTFDDDDTDDE
tara:strand:+ start:115 stop:2328 length:2214 start_codon:yes stop_codon:yes gene_type:complete